MSTAIDLVRNFRHLRVLVIGDAMLDTYLEGNAARLCSEGPVPIVHKTAEYRIPGGAANAAANVRALDADVVFLSMIGSDIAGMQLRAALHIRSISDRWLVEDTTMQTHHKLRILANGQYVVRFDEGAYHDTPGNQQRLIATLETVYASCDLVIVSDYRYGVLSEPLIAQLQHLQQVHPKVLLIDSKALHRFRNIEATVVTPNYLEAGLLIGDDASPSAEAKDLAEVAQVAQRLLDLLKTQHAAITLGEHGVFLLDRQGQSLHIPARAVVHANDVGAGDSFASAMGMALASGADIAIAAQIGIDAAGIAVTKKWTAVVQYQELLQRVSLREYAMQTHALFAPQTGMISDGVVSNGIRGNTFAQLLAHLDVERLTGRTIVFTNGVFDILHAGHVQFLRQAKALGDVLVVGVNSDRSTQRLKGSGRPINSEHDRVALVAALDAVDHVVLFDEDTPTELIRALRPALHVKGGDYADEALPEAEAVREGGGSVVILPLAGTHSTSAVINRIAALSGGDNDGEVCENA